MNIHPLFVHFPVALLSLYAIMELIRFHKLTAKEYWFYTKAILLFTGTVFSYAALYTGSLADDLAHVGVSSADRNSGAFQLINAHSNWAVVTAVIFSLISVVYLIEWIRRSNVLQQKFASFGGWQALLKLNAFLLSTWIIIPVALAGLIAITITGALGGAITYGPDADPVVHLIYHWFFKA